MIKFKVVAPVYNAEKWIHLCIRSLRMQSYQNFECYVVDDFSTDNTRSVIEKEIKDLNNFHLLIPETKGYPLGSLNFALDSANISDEDIVVIVDGDDWLYSERSLEIIKNTYENTGCYLTYGSYVEYPSKKRGKFAKKIPQHIIENKLYRQSEWMTSHMRTFKYKLWNNIDKQDIKDEDGAFYKRAGDLPATFCMLELAGERISFIEDILYVYNRSNPLNEDKIDHREQLLAEKRIRSSRVYETLREN
tara:strand:+ start:1057 stop:1800 length:744 start_codon:yes stop_codon:yes gene_type:complete